MTTKQNTINLTLTQEELEVIYSALNNRCIELADKSETMKKAQEGSATIEDYCHPDYYFELMDFTGKLQNRIYHAQQALKARATDPFRTVLEAIFA